MMNLKLLQAAALIALLGAPLTSCESSSRIDATNPTVSQMDALDVQWGLPKRTSRGGVRRFEASPSAVPTTLAPARQPAVIQPTEPAPQAAPAVTPPAQTIDPNVIKNLR